MLKIRVSIITDKIVQSFSKGSEQDQNISQLTLLCHTTIEFQLFAANSDAVPVLSWQTISQTKVMTIFSGNTGSVWASDGSKILQISSEKNLGTHFINTGSTGKQLLTYNTSRRLFSSFSRWE